MERTMERSIFEEVYSHCTRPLRSDLRAQALGSLILFLVSLAGALGTSQTPLPWGLLGPWILVGF
jgi:hypothetical protein